MTLRESQDYLTFHITLYKWQKKRPCSIYVCVCVFMCIGEWKANKHSVEWWIEPQKWFGKSVPHFDEKPLELCNSIDRETERIKGKKMRKHFFLIVRWWWLVLRLIRWKNEIICVVCVASERCWCWLQASFSLNRRIFPNRNGRESRTPTPSLMFTARLNRISASEKPWKKKKMLTKFWKNTGKSNLKPVRSRVDILQYASTTTELSHNRLIFALQRAN